MDEAAIVHWRFRLAIPPGSGRKSSANAGTIAPLRPAAIRRDRRSAQPCGGVGRPDRDDRRSARGRQRLRRRLADPADRVDRGGCSRPSPASPAPIARSTRWSWRSAWPAPGRRPRSSPGRFRSISSTASASPIPARPSSSPSVAASRRQCRDDAGRPTLRTVPVTTHIPLRDVTRYADPSLIEARGRAALRGLQRNFGIADPRLAVAGINPHAGEGGSLGREEIELDHAGDRGAAGRGLASDAARTRPTPCSMPPPAPIMTRRCACTTTRR